MEDFDFNKKNQLQGSGRISAGSIYLESLLHYLNVNN